MTTPRGGRTRARQLALPVTVAAVGLATLGVVQAVPNRHAVQSQLTDRSTRALSDAGITDARVRFDGRDATVHVRSAGDRDRALAVVRSQQGVRVAHVVVDHGAPGASPAPSSPPPKAPVPNRAGPTDSAQPPAASGDAVARAQHAVDACGAIRFASASAALTPTGRKAIEKVAAILRADASVDVEIRGFTDAVGPASTNLALSRARAGTVYDTLRVLGIKAARMSPVGYGESHPRVPNDSRAHRAANRRVSFAVRANPTR